MGNLWLFLTSKTFLVNAALALVFFIVLGLSAQSVLKWITGFGEVQKVPDLSGMSFDEALRALDEDDQHEGDRDDDEQEREDVEEDGHGNPMRWAAPDAGGRCRAADGPGWGRMVSIG